MSSVGFSRLRTLNVCISFNGPKSLTRLFAKLFPQQAGSNRLCTFQISKQRLPRIVP